MSKLRNSFIVVRWSEEDSAYIALVADLPSISGIGDSPEKAVAEVHEAAILAYEAMAQKRMITFTFGQEPSANEGTRIIMSDRVLAVVIVPEEGDPLKLLKAGLGWSTPPTAYWENEVREKHVRCLDCAFGGHANEDGDPHCLWCGEEWPCNKPDHLIRPAGWRAREWEEGLEVREPRALVLAWDGVLVEEGWDRLRRRTLFGGFENCPNLEDLIKHAGQLNDYKPFGKIILLDKDGAVLDFGLGEHVG
jgi:predicted RNase H-like HicB family nuclease